MARPVFNKFTLIYIPFRASLGNEVDDIFMEEKTKPDTSKNVKVIKVTTFFQYSVHNLYDYMS